MTTISFYDFNSAEEQTEFNLIPKGTIAKVNMSIKPGGYNNPDKGWTGGYATKSQTSEAIYLNCEFTVLEGEYKGRKIWNIIGLYSEKNDNRWGDIGRSFMRSLLNSAKGFSDKDNSDEAQNARKINSFSDLEYIGFVARIDIEQDQDGNYRNVIKCAIDPSHKEYGKAMGPATLAKPSWA